MKLCVSTFSLLAIFTAGCQLAEPPDDFPQFPRCGDGTCELGETRLSCPEDCIQPPVCGDGLCEIQDGESCASCAADCGACPPPRCASSIDLGGPAPLDRADTTVGAPTAVDLATCGDGATGPQIVYAWHAPASGVYEISVTGGFAIVLDVRRGDCEGAQAACDVAPIAGDAASATVALNSGQSIAIAIAGVGGDAGTFDLRIDRQADACGDGVCEASEDCSACASDCGACPFCGDHVCDATESYDSCPSDCAPPPYCGDGVCDLGEDCTTCSGDCGSC